MLGGQVKQVLRGLIDTGQWEQAYDVLGQLMLLLPGDLEALRMKQEISRGRSETGGEVKGISGLIMVFLEMPFLLNVCFSSSIGMRCGV